mgnify:CR=1 FL=1
MRSYNKFQIQFKSSFIRTKTLKLIIKNKIDRFEAIFVNSQYK